MIQSPSLTEFLAQDRANERRQEARRRAAGCSAGHRRARLSGARSVTGWFLVELGLRLIAPRRAARSV